ncbi:MAG: hypothetical protein JXB19_08475 [Bacteroidales bacterium]|nr:hypothetical protein [Bacteroidales bacterium]
MNLKINKRIPAVILFICIFSLFHAFSFTPFSDEAILRINPDYKLKRMSDGEVIIYTNDQANNKKSFSFRDFYADLLLAAYRKQRVEYFVQAILKKYYMSEDECRRELKHAINVLSEWNIIILEGEMASR